MGGRKTIKVEHRYYYYTVLFILLRFTAFLVFAREPLTSAFDSARVPSKCRRTAWPFQPPRVDKTPIPAISSSATPPQTPDSTTESRLRPVRVFFFNAYFFRLAYAQNSKLCTQSMLIFSTYARTYVRFSSPLILGLSLFSSVMLDVRTRAWLRRNACVLDVFCVVVGYVVDIFFKAIVNRKYPRIPVLKEKSERT